MTAPSPPFTTTAAVAYMLSVKLNLATDFSADTTPTKTAVEQFITWVDSQIEGQFRMAGYKIPLAVISGETWPTSQTTYLQLVSTLGVAAMAGGHSQRPAPALSASRQGGSGNVLQDLYQAELDKIFTLLPGSRGKASGNGVTLLNFRADYYAGSIAEMAVTEPKGPTTDFLESKYDPMRQLDNWSIADKILDIEQSMRDLEISWDYLYGLFSLNKGFATSVYEI